MIVKYSYDSVFCYGDSEPEQRAGRSETKNTTIFFFFQRTPKEAGDFNECERVYNDNNMYIYFNIYTTRVHHRDRRLKKKKKYTELIATINGNNNHNVWCLYTVYL